MPTRSSDIGTEQESGKSEVVMSSAKAKPVEPTVEAEAVETVEEPTEVIVDAEALGDGASPEEIAEGVAEPHTDAVGEATAQSVEADAFWELIETGRVRIDVIDDQILELVERRIEVAGGLLAAKHERRLNPRDKLRQGEILARLNGATDTLNKHQVRELYELLIRFGVDEFRRKIIDGRRG